MPELWAAIRRVEPDLSNLAEVYAEIEPESLDYGVMERWTIRCRSPATSAGATSAPGTRWPACGRAGGQIEAEAGGDGSFVLPHRDRVYGLVGVDDLLVVDTADALLIARRGSTQAVKELVERLRDAGRPRPTSTPSRSVPGGVSRCSGRGGLQVQGDPGRPRAPPLLPVPRAPGGALGDRSRPSRGHARRPASPPRPRRPRLHPPGRPPPHRQSGRGTGPASSRSSSAATSARTTSYATRTTSAGRDPHVPLRRVASHQPASSRRGVQPWSRRAVALLRSGHRIDRARVSWNRRGG
jgi:hypothetical protein